MRALPSWPHLNLITSQGPTSTTITLEQGTLAFEIEGQGAQHSVHSSTPPEREKELWRRGDQERRTTKRETKESVKKHKRGKGKGEEHEGTPNSRGRLGKVQGQASPPPSISGPNAVLFPQRLRMVVEGTAEILYGCDKR